MVNDMIIQPGTKIRFLHDVPLDSTYEHTIFFGSQADQLSYFQSKAIHTYNNFTYQRVSNNVVRVNLFPEQIYQCNYLMFQNTNYGTKWFYAFITEAVYINNECCEVHYEIDVMQTWFFECEVLKSFIERQHVGSDDIGENITPEPINTAEYIYMDYQPVLDMNDMSVIIAIVDTSGETSGTLYDGIYGSATLYAYDSTDDTGINAKVNEYVQKPDAIIGMYMCPTFLLPVVGDDHKLSYSARAVSHTVTIPNVVDTDTLDGYHPKNKKLYTYPYNFLHIDNASGKSLALRYEFFSGANPVVEIIGNITQPVQCVLRACSYKGIPAGGGIGGYTSLNTESLSLSNYPICSWNVDAYQAWVAQNSVPLVLSTIESGASLAVRTASVGAKAGKEAAIATGAIGGIGIVADLLSEVYTASIQADMSKGQLNNGSPNVSSGKQQFYQARACVPHQIAKMIDGFFDMYGYAIKSIDFVHRNIRPHWTYTKTVGVNLKGDVPAQDMRKIAQIYDAGITFWNDPEEVGDYSLDNSI